MLIVSTGAFLCKHIPSHGIPARMSRCEVQSLTSAQVAAPSTKLVLRFLKKTPDLVAWILNTLQCVSRTAYCLHRSLFTSSRVRILRSHVSWKHDRSLSSHEVHEGVEIEKDLSCRSTQADVPDLESFFERVAKIFLPQCNSQGRSMATVRDVVLHVEHVSHGF